MRPSPAITHSGASDALNPTVIERESQTEATNPAGRNRILKEMINFKFIGIVCIFILLLPVSIAAISYLKDKMSHNEASTPGTTDVEKKNSE